MLYVKLWILPELNFRTSDGMDGGARSILNKSDVALHRSCSLLALTCDVSRGYVGLGYAFFLDRWAELGCAESMRC